MIGDTEFTQQDRLQLQATCDAVLVMYNLIRDDALFDKLTDQEREELINAARTLRNYKYFA